MIEEKPLKDSNNNNDNKTKSNNDSNVSDDDNNDGDDDDYYKVPLCGTYCSLSKGEGCFIDKRRGAEDIWSHLK